MSISVFAAATLSVPASTFAQQAGPRPGWSWSASARSRVEAWDWFGAAPEGRYVYSGSIVRAGAGYRWRAASVRAEVGAPVLIGLPNDAIAPGPAGAAGLGASYFAANGGRRHAAALFVKQAYIELHGGNALRVRLGRSEFADGAESAPASTTLAALKRERIAQRLLGPFGWSHAGRSFDGAQVTAGAGGANLSALAAFATEGAFRVEGVGGPLPVGVVYAAVTAPAPWSRALSDLRVFGLHYRDGRSLPKVDNRETSIRNSDSTTVTITTIGAHALHELPTRAGPVDLLVWGAAQSGSWGRQRHRAYSVAVEGGWQPSGIRALKPWIRAGVSRASGDAAPQDARHETFMPILPTPRAYARMPFYTAMNLEDIFGTIVLRPGGRMTARIDLRALRLAAANDRWYAGGGAFDGESFGYAARPAGGATSLATLYDLSLEWRARSWATVTAYVAHASGADAIAPSYPNGQGATFAYIEVELRR